MTVPIMDGLEGFYSSMFPTLHKYIHVFEKLFAEFLPELYAHFEMEAIPPLLWIHKWF